jgi:hypothetical protein
MLKNHIVAKSHELIASSKKLKVQAQRIIAQSKELKSNTEKNLNLQKEFIKANNFFIKSRDAQIPEHDQIKTFSKQTIFLIQWENIEKCSFLSCRHTDWLTKNGYRKDPIVTNTRNSKNPENPYDLEIFTCDDEKVFALYVQLLTDKLLYYSIPDWNRALEMFINMKFLQELDCELTEQEVINSY